MSPPASEHRALEWVLRLVAALVFAGHGLTALSVHPPWLAFFTALGLSMEVGQRWMPIVGTWDLCLAVMMLVHPARALLLWMTLWALWASLLRPISGQSWLELAERSGNWGAPLALLLLRGWPRSWRDLLR